MAKMLKAKPAEEKYVVTDGEYVVKFNQDEIDMLAGMVADLRDNPQRQVSMTYKKDETDVVPNEYGYKVLKSMAKALNKAEQGPEYDYDNFWEDSNWPEDEA